jgi:hypothetical protein
MEGLNYRDLVEKVINQHAREKFGFSAISQKKD